MLTPHCDPPPLARDRPPGQVHFSLSLLSLPPLSQIHHLEAIALLAATRFEARHVSEESRSDALYLLKLKTLISLPIFLLSVAAATSAVDFTVRESSQIPLFFFPIKSGLLGVVWEIKERKKE